MGLDTYASNTSREIALTTAQEQAFYQADINLCGGLLSGNGGSFRGKVYASLICEITNVTLYQEWIPPKTVRKMVAAFEKLSTQDIDQLANREGHSTEEILQLKKFLEICAAHNLGLIGWW